MKRIFTTILALLIVQFALFAQPDGDVFPDFTVEDIEGNSHNLQEYLDDGKIVMIDVFATWCPICVSSLPAIESIYEEHGPDGDNTMVLLSFEKDAGTSNEASFVETHNITNPVIADGLDEVATWNTIGQPNFFMICSDGSFDYHFAGVSSSSTALTDMYDDCASLSTGVNDFSNELNLAYYSNPVTNTLTFEVQKMQRINYSIIDLSGKIVLQGQSNELKNMVDVSGLDRGIYFLQLFGQDQSNITKKIIKN